MSPLVIVNLVAFVGIIMFLARFRRPKYSLSRQVLLGLIAGIAFGFAMQFIYSGNPDVMSGTLEWTNVVGTTYINLLKMIVMPLVLVMMIAAVVRMREVAALGKIGGMVIAILIGTTMIAALVGILMANLFGLTAEGLTEGARELARADVLYSRQEAMSDQGLADMLVRFIPSNIFLDLTGARPTSVIAVVIFGILFGIAALMVSREDPEKAESIYSFVETVQAIIMKLVHIVMALTPYGILALMTKVVAGSNAQDIMNLISFVIASYIAIAIMFVVHGLLLRLNGVDVLSYYKTVWAGAYFCFRLAQFGSDNSAECRDAGGRTRRAATYRKFVRDFRRDDWPEWLRGNLPGHACNHGCANDGNRPDEPVIHRRAHRDRCDWFIWNCWRWRRGYFRRAGCIAGHGLSGHDRRIINFNRTAH